MTTRHYEFEIQSILTIIFRKTFLNIAIELRHLNSVFSWNYHCDKKLMLIFSSYLFFTTRFETYYGMIKPVCYIPEPIIQHLLNKYLLNERMTQLIDPPTFLLSHPCICLLSSHYSPKWLFHLQARCPCSRQERRGGIVNGNYECSLSQPLFESFPRKPLNFSRHNYLQERLGRSVFKQEY